MVLVDVPIILVLFTNIELLVLLFIKIKISQSKNSQKQKKLMKSLIKPIGKRYFIYQNQLKFYNLKIYSNKKTRMKPVSKHYFIYKKFKILQPENLQEKNEQIHKQILFYL